MPYAFSTAYHHSDDTVPDSVDALRQKIVKRIAVCFVYGRDDGKIADNGVVLRELLHGADQR